MMSKIWNWIKSQQNLLVLFTGFILISGLSFILGNTTSIKKHAPEIKIEEVFAPLNNSQKIPQTQSVTATSTIPGIPGTTSFCEGKIKGNIGQNNSRTYHLPGSSYYDRTVAEICFDTEQQAIDMGFRKVGK